MNYKSVLLPRPGGPEVLQVIEKELEEPGPGQVRAKILFSGVGLTDVLMRTGFPYPFAPPMPFVPGYEMVGVVEKVGSGVTGFTPGERVAALTVVGSYSEYITVPAQDLVKVPAELDPAEVTCLILNYITAYQMLHRVARVKAGERILVHGAAGGVGMALLQLGKVAGLEMYGTASRPRHAFVSELGATPIDYQSENFVASVLRRTGDGVDAAFDANGGLCVWRSFLTLRKGGRLVAYGGTGRITPRPGGATTDATLESQRVAALGLSPEALMALRGAMASAPQDGGFGMLAQLNQIPGYAASFYGITVLYRQDPRFFHEDMARLLEMLRQRQIRPVIGKVLPLAEASQAQALLEQASLNGKILLRP